MTYDKNTIIKEVKRIRKDIGHEDSDILIKHIIFEEETGIMWIITDDRGSKSAIIGKGGWVIGRLKEDLELKKIHVESYEDFIIKKYQMELSLKTIKRFIKSEKEENNEEKELTGIINLVKLLKNKIESVYSFNIENYIKNEIKAKKSKKHQCIVALSGGVDSSFSLIISHLLGFNPIAVTVDAGTIILPKQFKNNIDNLTKKLGVKHQYLKRDYSQVIEEGLSGRLHPCGRCSKKTQETLFKYAHENGINLVIFGDMLATGSQSITKNKITINNEEITMYRLNLPASLSIGKEEIRRFTQSYGVEKIKGFGCPLLHEAHKKFPHIKKFSIQRILRETRSGALEPGEALSQIWSFYRT